eukprot:TRINITY_DN27_c0_g1_i1.p1 TRINITY_DN27_c0_g1~~TRINITY_DN27_c0_g1_i1.p1  ORF type:complete len:499 (+),score=208.59 TRINITY_DN27_c0_g1_i1:77-1498(+)
MAGLDAPTGKGGGGMQFDGVLSGKLPVELAPFKARLSPRFYEMRDKVIKFVIEDILPIRNEYARQRQAEVDKVSHPVYAKEPPMLNELRAKAKSRGLYNFFLPEVAGLSVLEYSPIAEILGAVPLANQAMNCSAPDTGNMEVLEKYGTPEQKRKWLEPLLQGKIRSAFAMTEPGVASSDATNISASIRRDGDEYVINGHKWYISGACRPECKVFVFLGRNSTDGPLHRQHSMILVPRDAPGVKIVRPLAVFGHEHDHAEIIFDDVRVPATNMILGEGRGFEIAQGRLGPGRIHHCMRTIGVAEMALASIIYRANHRVAFGQLLVKKDTIRQVVAEARLDITKSRLLCYLAAVQADDHGFKAAKTYIAMTKIDAPRMALKVIDEAIQVHGAHGVSQDSRLSEMYTGIRTLRVADGPDIVHLNTIAKDELKRRGSFMGAMVSGTNKNIAKYGKFKNVKARVEKRRGGGGEAIPRL